MARVFKQVRGILTAPRRMFRELTLTNPAPLAAAVVCLTLGSLWLSLWASHSAVYADNVKAYAALAVVYSLTFLCGIALFSAVWHLTADMLGGAGRGLTLLYFILITTIPWWFAGPAAWLLQVILSLRGIYTVLLIILALWTLILMTIAFSQLYRFSIGKSLLVIILPVAVFSGLAAVILRALPEQFYWPW